MCGKAYMVCGNTKVGSSKGCFLSTEGNVIHYDFIEHFINELAEKYHILEIAVDR